MILAWESLSITELKHSPTETPLLLPLQPLKAKQQNTQKEKETLRGWSAWVLIYSLSEALCLMHLMKWGKLAVNSSVILSVLSGMCLGLLESISYLFVFKPSFSSFWNSSLNVTLTIIYVSNHDHGASVLSACSVSFNTADGMAFKQKGKKISTHMERDSSNEAASSPVHPQVFRACEYILALLKKKSKCKLLDSDQPTMLLFPPRELSLALFSPSCIQTHSQEDKVHILFYSKEN